MKKAFKSGLLALLFFTSSICAFAAENKIKLISPVEGTWSNKQMLIIDANPDCDYYYSLTGTDPEDFGFIYDGPVLIDMTGEVTLTVKMTGKNKGNAGLTDTKTMNYMVIPDEAFNTDYSVFISYFYESGVYNYTAGTTFYIPESLNYSLGLPPDSFIQGDGISISEKSVLSRNIPCTIVDPVTSKKWRFIIKTFPQNAGVFSRRDVPFYITDWDTITFTNENFIYKIDSEYWELPKESKVLDRTVSHMISWQELKYEQGNPVEFFVLPPKPELIKNVDESGAVTFSVSGDESYTLSVISNEQTDYQELFTEIGVDTFYGDNISGTVDIGVYANSVYQGKLTEEYKINKRPPSVPLITSTVENFYSREKVKVDVLGEEGSDLYVAVSEPFTLENSSTAYTPDSQLFADVKMKPFELMDSNSTQLLLEPESEGAFYYKVQAYSQNSKNTGKITEYSVIIDVYNFYYDNASTADYADGTVEHPYTTFADCMNTINKGRYACLHVKGELDVPEGQNEILSNLTIINDDSAVLNFHEGSSLLVRDSNLTIQKCRIQMENKDIYSQNKIVPLFRLERAVLDIEGCQASILFGKNGAFADGYSSAINIFDSIMSLSASTYALCVSGVKTKLNVQRSSINVSADTSVLFSVNEGDIVLKTNSFKVIGQKGRIAELFSVYGTVSNNNFKADLRNGGNASPIYKDKQTSLKEADNELYGF